MESRFKSNLLNIKEDLNKLYLGKENALETALKERLTEIDKYYEKEMNNATTYLLGRDYIKLNRAIGRKNYYDSKHRR